MELLNSYNPAAADLTEGKEGRVLSDYPIGVVLLATDMDASREFYANKIGLAVLTDSRGAVTFKCGGDSRLVISKSSVGFGRIRQGPFVVWVSTLIK